MRVGEALPSNPGHEAAQSAQGAQLELTSGCAQGDPMPLVGHGPSTDSYRHPQGPVEYREPCQECAGLFRAPKTQACDCRCMYCKRAVACTSRPQADIAAEIEAEDREASRKRDEARRPSFEAWRRKKLEALLRAGRITQQDVDFSNRAQARANGGRS